MDKKAFTLAEVLITLGIIGVVSAMTLPALVNQTRGKELETGLKKAYSVIQNAVNQMNYDEGQVVNAANYGDTGNFMEVFKKYFKLSKDCGKSSCESQEILENEQLGSINYKSYTNIPIGTGLLDDGQTVTIDGMFFMIENNPQSDKNWLFISVDVNGIHKKPNRWGHDLFTFQILDNGKLAPMGAQDTVYRDDKYCSNREKSNISGIGCTYKALTEKDYFKNLPK